MVGRWSEAATLKFVYFYKLHECLWNTKSEQYTNKESRVAAYTDLVFQMGMQDFDVRSAKVKIKNLRAHYFTELKKVRNALAMGHNYEPTLYWFKEMDSFLKDVIGDIPSLQQPEVITADSIYDSSLIYENGIGDFHFDEDSMGKASPIFHMTPPPQVRGGPSAAAAKKNRGSSNGMTPSAPRQRNRKRPNQQQEPFDEFEVFGKSVAAQLRKLSVTRALRAQTSIQAILTEERLHDLETITPLLPSSERLPSVSEPLGGGVRGGLLGQPPTTISEGLLVPPPNNIGERGLLIQQPATRPIIDGGLIGPEPSSSGGLIVPESSSSGGLIVPEPTSSGGLIVPEPTSSGGLIVPEPTSSGGLIVPEPSSVLGGVNSFSPPVKSTFSEVRPKKLYKQAKPSCTPEIKPECDVITLDEDDPFEGH